MARATPQSMVMFSLNLPLCYLLWPCHLHEHSRRCQWVNTGKPTLQVKHWKLTNSPGIGKLWKTVNGERIFICFCFWSDKLSAQQFHVYSCSFLRFTRRPCVKPVMLNANQFRWVQHNVIKQNSTTVKLSPHDFNGNRTNYQAMATLGMH